MNDNNLNNLENNVVTGNENPDVSNLKICDKCGQPLPLIGNCSNCGATGEDDNGKKGHKTLAIVILIIAIFNVLILVPIISYFALFFAFFGSVFGALGSNQTNYEPLIAIFLWFGYLGASLFGLIGSIINAIKKGNKITLLFIMTIIGFVLGLAAPFIIVTVMPIIDNSNTVTSIENNAVVYQDDDYTIRQIGLKKTNSKVTATFYVEKNDPDLDNIKMSSYVTINGFFLPSDYTYEKDAVNVTTEERSYENDILTITADIHYYDNYYVDKVESFVFYLYNNNHLLEPVKVKIDNEDVDIEKDLRSRGYKVAMENEYFRVYYKPDTENHIYLYIEGKADKKYYLVLHEIDADTKVGKYIGKDYLEYPLFDNTITIDEINYHPCDFNMSYLKITYTIYDENKNIVGEDEELLETTFDGPQFSKKYCQAE
jgi:flagellar basal body-associated protein FliL